MDAWVYAIMIFNLLLSMWNAYAVGFNSVALERYKGRFKDFFQIANSFGLVMAFAGAAYSLSFFLSLIGSYLGYVSPGVLELIGAYSFLVFGGLITFTGLVVTIESILYAYLTRSWLSIFVAIYNSLASLWNLYSYISSFQVAQSIIGSADEQDQKNAYVVLIFAALLAIFLVYGFYQLGKKRAQRELVG